MTITRRDFLSTTVATAIGASLSGFSGISMAAGGYELISPPQNTSDTTQVEVLKFFWLGCPHCYSFEPNLVEWKKSIPENVVFVREAPPLNPAWEQHSRAFYAAQVLGHEDAFVEVMFNAIHEERKRMRSPKEIAQLAAGIGMEEDKFIKTMNSFAVQTKMNRAIQLAKSAGISGVPSVVINGKYRTGAGLAGGNAGIIRVINETIAVEKAAMGLN